MTFRPDWRRILTRAWSVRLMLLAGLLSGLEVALQYIDLPLPPGVFAALMTVIVAAAFIARLMAQENLPHG